MTLAHLKADYCQLHLFKQATLGLRAAPEMKFLNEGKWRFVYSGVYRTLFGKV